jgi:hypothetical protein
MFRLLVFFPADPGEKTNKQTGKETYAFVFFSDLDKAQLKHSFKKPSAPVYVVIVSGERYLIDAQGVDWRFFFFLPFFEFE